MVGWCYVTLIPFFHFFSGSCYAVCTQADGGWGQNGVFGGEGWDLLKTKNIVQPDAT